MKNIKNGLPPEDGRYLVRKNIDKRICFEMMLFAENPYKTVDDYDFDKSDTKVFYDYDSEYGYFMRDIDDITHWLNVKDIEIEE